jgi:hypothetical protein
MRQTFNSDGKSKILKSYTEIFISGLSICEPAIHKVFVIVQIYEKHMEIADKTIHSERPLKWERPKVMFILRNI